MIFFINFFKAIGVWPPDDSESPKAWRRSTFGVLWITSAFLFAHIALEKGFGFGLLEITPVARAGEVDQKIAKAVNPINDKLVDVDNRTIAILRLQYAPIIRERVRDRCNTTNSQEKEKINQSIERIERQFKLDSGQDYGPRPTCDDV